MVGNLKNLKKPDKLLTKAINQLSIIWPRFNYLIGLINIWSRIWLIGLTLGLIEPPIKSVDCWQHCTVPGRGLRCSCYYLRQRFNRRYDATRAKGMSNGCLGRRPRTWSGNRSEVPWQADSSSRPRVGDGFSGLSLFSWVRICSMQHFISCITQ